jgi:hypothetical protein
MILVDAARAAKTDPEPAPSVGFLSAMSPGSAASLLDTRRPAVSSGAALMLGYLRGGAIDMAPVVDTFGIRLATVDRYARAVLGKSAA